MNRVRWIKTRPYGACHKSDRQAALASLNIIFQTLSPSGPDGVWRREHLQEQQQFRCVGTLIVLKEAQTHHYLISNEL